MRTIALGFCIVMALCVVAQAQPGNVPAIAQDEVSRRGSHVEQTGTIRSGLISAALSPPADDSAKWFLTLIVQPGEPASEKMRATIANDPSLRAWVDTRDPSKSALHYQVRSINDRTQADWLQGLQPAIQRSGLPLIVLQPPKNGQFGPSSTIVKLIAGVLTGEQLTTKLREAIVAYVQAIESPGISQSAISVPPPFSVPPNPAPAKPEVPFEWPTVAPASTPPVSPANPPVPASEFPTPWLAFLAIGMFVAGWVSARIKTLVDGKIADINRTIAILRYSSVPKNRNEQGQTEPGIHIQC